MKVVILAGGFGTRLSEYTDLIPKPMVRIGEHPILIHIMNHYASFGFTDFIIALGYKSEVIKDYFLNFHTLNSDFSVNLGTGDLQFFSKPKIDWNITLVNTGGESMTGGRLKRLTPYLEDQDFFMTYGDGLSDVDIAKTLEFHKSHNKLATVTSVIPTARFGEINSTEDGSVISFEEKPKDLSGRINGGFFVFKKEFLNCIEDDSTVLEQAPLINATSDNQLMAYAHDGFWQCMDTKRDVDFLNELWTHKKNKWRFIL